MSISVVRTRKIFINKLFNRKQMALDIIHPSVANLSKEEIAKTLATRFKQDERNVVVYGLETQFGGGRSTGFALIYDTQQYLFKFEPKFRLRRRGAIPKKIGGRKAWKELKSKMRKTRGKEITKIYNSRKTDKVHEIRQLKKDYLKTFVAK